MTLRSKILVGYGVAVVLLAAALGWSVAALARLATASDAILRENYWSILAAENMLGSLERQDSGVLLLLLGFEQEGGQEFRQGESGFFQWLARAKDNVTLPGEADLLNGLETGYGNYLRSAVDLRRSREADLSAGSPRYHEQLLPLFREVRADVIRLRELNREAMVAASARAESIANRALLTTVLLGAILVVAGLVSSALLTRRIVRPLSTLSAAADRIAEGHYDVELPETSGDEFGHLAARFAVMARKLQAFRDLDVGRVIAEKRRSDAIIRSIGDGIVVLDHEFQVVSMNPIAEAVLGVRQERAVGQTLRSILGDEALAESVRELATAGRARRPGADQLVLPVPHEEGMMHYELEVTEVQADSGAPLGFVLKIEDITHFRELDRLKTEFVATASHQLRTPLTSMSMSLDLLGESAGAVLEERDQELLNAAREDAQRMKALVNELLDLSRMESGQLTLELEQVDMGSLAESIVATFHSQAEEAGIELALDVGEELPPVRADPTKIGWVTANLISNALRYTDPGGHIVVSAEAVREFVQVSVSDDGAGIPFELQARIFEKFVQVPGERAQGGSGLGLAIAKAIVNDHGGTIWVDSTPGQGSTFTFLVPRFSGVPQPTGGAGSHA
jgi:NtrC-family two-component system sensor histidine kinase KinB